MGNENTKLIEASMALLQAVPDQQLKIVALNKALFYLDLIALRDVGHVVTDQKYVALPMGPVVENYPNRVVKALVSSGYAEQLTVGAARPLHVVRPYKEYKHLDDTVLAMAADMGRLFVRFTSTLLSDYSHKNPGWLIARQRYVEGRQAPEINMRIAMQQLGHDDNDWLDSGIDADLLAKAEQADDAKQLWK
jgi:uncharacterized phage-associated protein